MVGRYVIGVSGGIDSVVLLDAFLTGRSIGRTTFDSISKQNIVVAHFDHGIRNDSADDAQFVADLARRYGVTFHTKREELGPQASEEYARDRRYAFLREVCKAERAVLMTAHHADDVIETVAINVCRGTGWRGLAVMDNQTIYRPLLDCMKTEILEYAKEYSIDWREDSTNSSDVYLRNRIRSNLRQLDQDDKRQLLALWTRQVEVKRLIDEETSNLIGASPYSRYLYVHCGDTEAIELLRAVFEQETGLSPTIPVRQRVLNSIKVARHGATINVMSNVDLQFTHTNFVVRQTR